MSSPDDWDADALAAMGEEAVLQALQAGDDAAMFDQAIYLLDRALDVAPSNWPRRPWVLSNLGSALQRRFRLTNHMADLGRAIEVLEEAATSAPTAGPNRLGLLRDLRITLRDRFERTGDRTYLDRAVEILEQAVNSTPPDHPSRRELLFNFALALHSRFERTANPADLDRGIEVYEQEVAATAPEDPEGAVARSNLGIALHSRFERTDDLSDLNRAIELHEEALAATPTDHPEWGAGPTNLANALGARFERTSDPTDLDRAIELSEEVLASTPTDHPQRFLLLSNLGAYLTTRFAHAGGRVDLDRAIKLQEEVVASTPTNHPRRAGLLANLGDRLQARFAHMGDVTDLNRAINFDDQAVDAIPADHPDKPRILNNLGVAMESRFQRTGDPADLDRAIEVYEQSTAPTQVRHPIWPRFMSNLGNALRLRFENSRSLGDLDDAIDRHTQAVDATPNGDADRPTRLSNLGTTLLARFGCTDSDADLDSAIDAFERAVVAMPADHRDRTRALTNLAGALQIRLARSGSAADLVQMVEVLPEAARNSAAPLVLRARAAQYWGIAATIGQAWDQAVQAYSLAIELATLAVPWELGRADQEFRLGDFVELGSAAAAAAIEAGDPPRAVELFEQGRAILFSQILDIRSDLIDLQQTHPDLADRFVRCRDALNQPDAGLGGVLTSDAVELAAAQRNAESRRTAAAEFQKVLSEIRAMRSFERFLAPRQINELLAAAEHGPVVLINIAALRSDALILTTDGVESVSLPGVTPADAAEQANKFLGAIDVINSSASTPGTCVAARETMREVLGWLGDNATSPVLDHLGYTSTPPAGASWPRVWWCPAGVLSLLPIHAVGHHDHPSSGPADAVIDRVISSNIPTLRALLHARAAPAVDPTVRTLIVAMCRTPPISPLCPGSLGKPPQCNICGRARRQCWGCLVAKRPPART